MDQVKLTDYTLPKEQFSIHFIVEHGAIILDNQADKSLVIGLIKENHALLSILLQYYPDTEFIFKKIDELELSTYLNHLNNKEELPAINVEEMEPTALASAPHFIRLVNTVLSNAINAKASDIHIEGFSQYCIVRYRLDGVLKEVERFSAHQFRAIASRLKIMASLNIMENRLPQDGRLTFNNIHMRISIIPLAAGESIVLRILEKDGRLLSLHTLGFDTKTLAILEEITQRKHGLFIVTGPTGSGKTTTLTTILSTMDYQHKKIISLEDPIEYVIDGIDQVQIHEDIGLTFESLLRRCLRQDPDVLLIGEMRDKESADLAIRSSLTGHLVLSTLHTNDALGVIIRLKNMGIEPYLIADVLIGVLSQRLVRLLCPDCQSNREINQKEIALFSQLHRESTPEFLPLAMGCSLCRDTGYRGRTVVSEILLLSKELQRLIHQGASEDQIQKQLLTESFKPIQDQAIDLVLANKTTLEEVLPLVYL